MINSNTAIFLDRDGVINKEKDDYVKSVGELEIFPYVGNSIKKIHKLGFLAIVITNQSAINRGLTTHENIIMIHDQIQEILKPFQTKIDAFYYCPHMPKEYCSCRKPKTGLILKAAATWEINLESSWVFGDSDSDVIAGKSVGCKTIKITPNFNLQNAVEQVEELLTK